MGKNNNSQPKLVHIYQQEKTQSFLPFFVPQLPYVSIDFDRWEVWSSSEEDEEDDGARAAPTNPNSSRRESGDGTENKQVLLPEMLVTDSSESDEGESFASDVDTFNFS